MVLPRERVFAPPWRELRSRGAFPMSPSSKAFFPTFDEVAGRSDLVVRAGLTSSSSTEQGIGTWGSAQGGGQTFSADGMDAASAHGIRFDIDVNAPGTPAKLQAGGTISFEITRGFSVESDLSANTFVLTYGDGSFIDLRVGGGFRDRLGNGSVNHNDNTNEISNLGRENDRACQVVVVWDADHRYTFVDGLLLSKVIHNPSNTTVYNDIYVGSSTSSNGATTYGANMNIRNFYLLDTPLDIRPTESVLLLGDSIVVGGAQRDDYAQLVITGDETNVDWAPTSSGATGGGTNYGVGFTGGDAYAGAFGTSYDRNLVCEFFRTLSKGGLHTSGNGNYAQQGAAASGMDALWTRAITGGIAPTIVVCAIGTDDVGALRDAATWRATMQPLVTRAFEERVKRMVIWAMPTLANESPYDQAAYVAKVHELNAEVWKLLGWSRGQQPGLLYYRLQKYALNWFRNEILY